MAAPQRNYPYNPQLAKALAFNRNDPQFNSVMSIYGSDGGREGDVLPQGIQPGAGGNQVQQGPHVPNVAEVAEGVAAGQNAPSVEPALIAANTSATADQALAVGAPGSAGPSSVTSASNATGGVVPQAFAHHETTIPQAEHTGSQPEAGSSAGASLLRHTLPAADIPSPHKGSDMAHEATSGTSGTTTTEGSTKSRRGRKGAPTPNHPPRRSLRESALRTAQLLQDILVPRPRRGRRTTAATNSGGSSTSTTVSISSTPPAVQSMASTSRAQKYNKSNEKEKESKAGPSAKALGKRRRIEPETDEEDEDADDLAPSDSEGASPTKKARRVRNLRNMSTPARFDIPKEEPISPSLSLATPKRKRASNDEDEGSAGPSKRGRVANDEEALAPLLGPILLASAPRRDWSVEAQPSIVGVAVRPVVEDARPLPAPAAQIPPSFIVVLQETVPQAQQQAHPPPPSPPYPLRRTFAKIFTRGG
ncbi:hypothetical protein FRC04_010298 [Tulasnella sp. 424]|nr:hypothetical protein FRC04_010298 [Tulasnella sp. 424]KAG8972680.1 hypothetical protein FRC05_009691 [Tulasnella sp. 425]